MNIIKYIFAYLTLPLLIPILVILGLLILFFDGLPIFYTPVRTGINNTRFKIFKFRTMKPGSDKFAQTTSKYDKRVTKIGKIYRKFKLDELPQIFNIISGDMNFVGPRPELPKYTDLYNKEYLKILSVKPGITDISSLELSNLNNQISDSNADLDFENNFMKYKNDLRLKYVNEKSFILDFTIFIKTFIKIFIKFNAK